MYEQFYGLKKRAFNLTPDPAFLYLNERDREAFDNLLYGIERRHGFAAIIGDVGTGKTTICWALLERLERKNVCTALIQNPTISEADIMRSILLDLGVQPDHPQTSQDPGGENPTPWDASGTGWVQGMNRKQVLDRINRFLAEKARENVFTVIIVDEAQGLSMTMLEQLRLLSNVERAKNKLLQIIFVGQPELDYKFKSTSLRQLNQRISVRFETKTLSKEDTERYILHRLAVAGGAPQLFFESSAFKAIWQYSKGYPRLINLVCDRALLAGYLERSLVITSKLVRQATLDLQGKRRIVVRIPVKRDSATMRP
jgi:general secretion pathway protein A